MKNLITHTFIEFYYRGGQGLIINEQLFEGKDRKNLLEAYGVPSGCEETAGKLARMIINLLPAKNIEFEATDLNFVENINVFVEDGLTTNAIYIPDETIVADNGLFKSINIYINSSITNDYYDLFVYLIHELTHAKQDNDLRIKRSGIKQEINKIGYSKHSKILPNAEDIKKHLGNLLYYLNQYEKGAFVSMLRGKCERVKDNIFSNISEAIGFLKTTGPYRTYEIIHTLAEYYGNVNQSEEQKEKIMSVLKEISDYNFPSFKDFSKWVNTRANKVLSKMDEVIPKMACDYLKIRSGLAPAKYLSKSDFKQI